jgi:hypothetical protein
MSAAEFMAWLDREALDPLPDRRAELQRAVIAADAMNAAAKRTDGRGWRPLDYLPFDPEPPPPPAAEIGAGLLAHFQALAAVRHGKD